MTKERFFCHNTDMKTKIIFWLGYSLVIVLLAQQYKTEVPDILDVTPSTIKLIHEFEGSMTSAYKDIKGNWTVGVGHLIRKDERHLLHTKLSEEEVQNILHNDLKVCSEAVKTAVKVPVNRPQVDAMYSLCHNIGPDNFARSEVVKHLNDGNIKKAADSFLNWAKPAPLKKRREAERELFLTNI